MCFQRRIDTLSKLRKIKYKTRNNLLILSGTNSIEEKEFYIKMCIKNNYSKRELDRQMASGYFQRYMLSNYREEESTNMNPIENLKDLIIYQSQNNENISVEVLYDNEDFWLTQKSMSKLFEVEVNTINYHLKEIFKSGELTEESVIRKIRITANDGKNYNTNFYSLDAIIAVGYRVNSKQATDFRIWATNTLKEYIKKGFVLNDELLKNGPKFGKDYFKELLERIRSIRTSERRIWQQITDIFAECSIDYDKNSDTTQRFYATVQNKFHYAITGNTAAEIIYQKANHTKENMGLTTWKNSPDGRILKSDVIIAKNYLDEKQIKRLERTVSGYFDYIEDLVERENTFTMEEFSKSINEFLEFRKYDILKDNGKISRRQAEEKAEKEYNEFNKSQKIVSDFDKLLIEANRLNNKK